MKANRIHEFRDADSVHGRLCPLTLAPLAGRADVAKGIRNQYLGGTIKKRVLPDGAFDQAVAQNPAERGVSYGERSVGAPSFTSQKPITLFLLLLMLLATASSAFAQSSPAANVQLYTCDCGLTEFKDAEAFSDTGEYEGKSLALPASAT